MLGWGVKCQKVHIFLIKVIANTCQSFIHIIDFTRIIIWNWSVTNRIGGWFALPCCLLLHTGYFLRTWIVNFNIFIFLLKNKLLLIKIIKRKYYIKDAYLSKYVILLQLLEIASRTPVVVIYTYRYHSAQFQDLCSMKYSSETLQNLPYFI